MFIRILRALIKYFVAFHNLGFVCTLKIIYFSMLLNLLKSERESILNTKHFGIVNWNTRKDLVIGHFYTPQIEIFSPSDDMEITSIVDLGANIGIESKRFFKLYPKARIIAVEAEKRNFELLKKNLKDCPCAQAFHAAVWSNNAFLKIISRSIDSQSWSLIEVDREDDSDMIGMTFNEIIKQFDVKHIDLLKVDIEGAEKELFSENCSEWINIVKCIVVECPDNENPFTTEKIFRNLNSFGFKFNTYVNGENLVLIRDDLDWKPRLIEIYN